MSIGHKTKTIGLLIMHHPVECFISSLVKRHHIYVLGMLYNTLGGLCLRTIFSVLGKGNAASCEFRHARNMSIACVVVSTGCETEIVDARQQSSLFESAVMS
ncbi:hypothetical protein CEXT_462371 [Caerostris extrusa]|uniref:Uncharacterized protein n=1 Tax=Caerostris extrusa TaxID=172846 RepID=A0AAV4U0S2_CAEEX|nr:hypothetical protein CEXT_462371 [Caerostris extrusa]